MDRLSVVMALGLVSSGLVGCGEAPDPATLPDASDTITSVGKRLGAMLSPADLELLGEDEARLLRSLTDAERLSLGRAYLRFRVDRPAIVEVAVPGRSPPFWLADAGFRPLGRSIRHPDGPFCSLVATIRGGYGRTRRERARSQVPGALCRLRPGLGRDAQDDRDRTHRLADSRSGRRPGGVLRRRPPLRRRPRRSETSPNPSSGKEWRDSTALIRGKVWKTRVPSVPKPRPDRRLIRRRPRPFPGVDLADRPDGQGGASLSSSARPSRNPPGI